MNYSFVGLIRWPFFNSPGSAETVALTPMLGIQLRETERQAVKRQKIAAAAVAKVLQKSLF